MKQTDVTVSTDDYIHLRSQKGLDQLLDAVAAVDDPAFLKEFFTCLFTPAELHDIGKRWLLVNEIDRGTTQRDIARMFKMSLCKITRGSRELKKEGSAFRRMIDITKKQK